MSCRPRGTKPGLRGGVGRRWRRAAVEGFMATDDVEDSADTERNMLTGACWVWTLVLAETVLIVASLVAVVFFWVVWVVLV